MRNDPGDRDDPGAGPPRTRAAARPRASTSSGVSSALAIPLTPSVPNFRVTAARFEGSALGVLRGLAGLLQAVLLGFLLARVASQKPGPLEGEAQVRFELGERPRDSKPEGTCLTRHPPA